MSARDQVLALPELLEIILTQLPMRDLLLAQRVSKTWQAIIALKPLQRKLFFEEPINSTPLQFIMLEIESPFYGIWEGNRLSSVVSFQDFNDQIYHPQGQALVQDTGVEYMWTHANSVPTITTEATSGAPVKPRKCRPIPVYENPVLMEFHTQLNNGVISTQSHALLPKAWQRPEASWRKMLVSSPSSIVHNASLKAIIGTTIVNSASWREPLLPFPKRLGGIYDQVEKAEGREEIITLEIACAFTVVDGVRLEILGREMWEVPGDEGWSRDKKCGRYGILTERMA